MSPVLVFSFILVIVLTVVFAQLRAVVKEEGDVCLRDFWDTTTSPWVCTLVRKCPQAIKLLKQRKSPPPSRRCGFKDKEPIVCCPPYEIADWSGRKSSNSESLSRRQDSRKQFSRVPSLATLKCREYSQLYNTQRGRPEVSFLTGGADSRPKEFPHMALLGYGYPPKYRCGGTLISKKFILSAAHCETHPEYGPVRVVRLGDLDIGSTMDDSFPRDYAVGRKFVHKGYRSESVYNDIMVIELEKSVQFNSYVKPVCLYAEETRLPVTGIVTGWGSLKPIGSPSPSLQKLEVPFVSAEECNEAFKSTDGSSLLDMGILNETQICAGAEPGKDACLGDSGGPLQIQTESGLFSQVGIVSFGPRICGTPGSPGVYTRISAYIPWIESIVWPQGSNRARVTN